MKAPVPRHNRREWLQSAMLLSPGLLWTLIFFLLPLIIMLVYSLWQYDTGDIVREWSLENYNTFFTRSHFRSALFNSLQVAVIVTLLSIVLAYPAAYIIAYRIPVRWQRLALLMAILPFWTSYVVRSYSWLLILTERGVISQTIQLIGFEPISLANNRTGTVIGFVHFFMMLLTLTIFANLVQISPGYRKAAADLGASPWQIFTRVTLPLSMPGIIVGAFLTFVLCLGDYITPQILGGNQELLLPQLIMLQVRRQANFPMASALSMILMLVVTVTFIAAAPRLRLERV